MTHLPLRTLVRNVVLLGRALQTTSLAPRRHALRVLAELLFGFGLGARVQ